MHDKMSSPGASGRPRMYNRSKNEARQLIALADVGVDKKNIYMDKQSGKNKHDNTCDNRAMLVEFLGTRGQGRR